MDHILNVVQAGSEPSVNDPDVMSPYSAAAVAAVAALGGRRDSAGEEMQMQISAGGATTTAATVATATGQNKADFIAFRSKVVSRTHAELWLAEDGQIMFRDVGSSSGTFLNRLRLSPSGRESRPYPIKSGDVIQLGVDYQGRQEEIYKCVQMKVFVSQKSKERPKTNPARLRLALKILLAAMNPTARDASDASCTDCCICLSTLSPQQALFLAPCSHCFHYRCVMPLLGSNIMFQCPLCRQVANLDANVVEEDGVSGGVLDYLSSSSDDGGEGGEDRSGAGGGTVDEDWARSILAFEGMNLGGSAYGSGGDGSSLRVQRFHDLGGAPSSTLTTGLGVSASVAAATTSPTGSPTQGAFVDAPTTFLESSPMVMGGGGGGGNGNLGSSASSLASTSSIESGSVGGEVGGGLERQLGA
ncbi:hypothetical protein HDU67_000467 [Dinochytrium kinnereticum]|nr:hypothetical protein HDU67_000467 [Dinochytrium kinnereticum]